MLRERSPIMLPLGSIGYDSFPAWTFRVHATLIQSSRGDISFISAKDLISIGIQEEMC